MRLAVFIYFMFHVTNGQLQISKDFGDYNMDVDSIELCKGTKKNNLTNVFLESTTINDNKFINGNFTVLKEIGPVMFKGKLLKWIGKRFESLLRYKSDNICEFDSVKQKLFDEFASFSSTANEHCTLKQGTKILVNVDVAKLGKYLLGTMYFYGHYKYISEYFTDKGNIICTSSIFTLKKM